MKRLILIPLIALCYLHIVTPEKKPHKKHYKKVTKRHGALKVVFGGCLLLILLSCEKITYSQQQPELIKCSDWSGMWFSFDGDTIMKDSIIIEVKDYGFKNGKSYVQYKCNVPELDSVLWHYCPYKWTSDDIHIVYKGKNMYFRYFH